MSPPRPVPITLISGRAHYETIVAAVLEAQLSVWIATANLKELMVEDTRAAPGRRRTQKGTRRYRSVIAVFDELARRGVDLRILHAGLPSRAFRAEFDRHPRLVKGGLDLRVCPRVHLKLVIVDGAIAYLGSANWTGAGLGAKGVGRRNFELGIVTQDDLVLDEVQEIFDRIWRGAECGACTLRDVCAAPLDNLGAKGSGLRRRRVPRRSTPVSSRPKREI